LRKYVLVHDRIIASEPDIGYMASRSSATTSPSDGISPRFVFQIIECSEYKRPQLLSTPEVLRPSGRDVLDSPEEPVIGDALSGSEVN